MESKPINDPALRNLERTIRFEFEKIILIMAIVCVSLEVAIFFYYYFTDNVGQPVNTYIEFRILVPLLVNCVLYLITREWQNRPVRFDVVEVSSPDIIHIPDAFQPGGMFYR